MRTSPNLLRGVAAAALLVTVYGIAAGTSGAMPGSPGVSGSARHAQADPASADMRQLAQLKRDIVGKGAEHAGATQPRIDTFILTDLKQLAQVKRDIVRETARRAGGW
jgi:hypothetical protein